MAAPKKSTPSRQVHRGLSLTSPLTEGADVKALQGQINEQFDHFAVDRHIAQDGEFGPATLSACRQVAIMLGVGGKAYRKLKAGHVSMATQKLIRGRKKTLRERAAMARRRGYRQKLRRRFHRSGGVLALTWAKQQIGITESPADSNWGPQIGEWIKYTGYTWATVHNSVFWCGCFVCYAVVKIAGAKIPTRIRLGFDGYIVSDANARTNGLTVVGFSEARAGDIVTYTYPHIELVDHVSGDSIVTVGGNTSAQNSGGSDSNGGGVFPRTRSRSEVACIARPEYN
jgi:hypothetical protein